MAHYNVNDIEIKITHQGIRPVTDRGEARTAMELTFGKDHPEQLEDRGQGYWVVALPAAVAGQLETDGYWEWSAPDGYMLDARFIG